MMSKEFTTLEEKYRLKYLYFIDIDKVIANIKNSSEYITFKSDSENCNNIANFFHKIFSEIQNNSLEYNSYIYKSSCNSKDFFNLKTNNNDSNISSYLLYLTFFNHCILHGLFYSLKKNHQDKQDTIAISYSKETELNVGYFNNTPVEEKLTSFSLDYDRCFSRYNKKMERIDKDYYSIKILNYIKSKSNQSNNYIDENTKENRRQTRYFLVPAYLKNVSYALFSSTKINLLNRNLIEKSPRTLTNYISLYEHFVNSICNNNYNLYSQSAANSTDEKNMETGLFPKLYLKDNTDKLLYTTPMEYFYGFSTTASLCKLFNCILDPPKSLENLKYLESELFNDVIKNLFQCPIVYGRHFLFNYACMSIIKSGDLYSEYLNREVDDFGKIILPKYYTNITTITTIGLANLQKFFHVINNITLPILETMWNICIEELIDSNHCKTYKTYLDKYYNYIIYDYSALLNFTDKKSLYNNDLYNKLSNNLIPTAESIDLFCKSLNIKAYDKSSFLSDLKPTCELYITLNNILLSSLKYEHIFNFDTKIPICNDLYPIDPTNEKDLKRLEFFISHRKNLIKFYNQISD